MKSDLQAIKDKIIDEWNLQHDGRSYRVQEIWFRKVIDRTAAAQREEDARIVESFRHLNFNKMSAEILMVEILMVEGKLIESCNHSLNNAADAVRNQVDYKDDKENV